MVGFDAENDDAIYHSSKFIEDVPLLIIAEIWANPDFCTKST